MRGKTGLFTKPCTFHYSLMNYKVHLLEGGANGINFIWAIKIFSLVYADDLVFIAESKEDLKLQMRTPGSHSNEFEMEINLKKTKVTISNSKSKTLENKVFGLIRNRDQDNKPL